MAEDLEKLRKQMESCGGPDKYIDEDEEQDIFRFAEKDGVSKETCEAVLNQMCVEMKWTREREIIADLKDQLEEATKDDGVIDQKEFDHCVNYGVLMNMPRKRAMEISVKFVLSNSLKVKKGWFGKDWFEPLRRQYQK